MKIAILGEYDPTFAPHAATEAAIGHSANALSMEANASWLSTADISQELFKDFDALWVAPGSPYRDMEKTIWAIKHARQNHIPCFGTCGGFQHMLIEYARNVLGMTDAQHAEYDPYASNLFISELACSLAGREMELTFVEDSQVALIYGSCSAIEQYYCNFSVNPQYLEQLRTGPLQISGWDDEGEVRVVEYPEHPFFIGTLFIPQVRSTSGNPHPLVNAFLRSANND